MESQGRTLFRRRRTQLTGQKDGEPVCCYYGGQGRIVSSWWRWDTAPDTAKGGERVRRGNLLDVVRGGFLGAVDRRRRLVVKNKGAA